MVVRVQPKVDGSAGVGSRAGEEPAPLPHLGFGDRQAAGRPHGDEQRPSELDHDPPGLLLGGPRRQLPRGPALQQWIDQLIDKRVEMGLDGLDLEGHEVPGVVGWVRRIRGGCGRVTARSYRPPPPVSIMQRSRASRRNRAVTHPCIPPRLGTERGGVDPIIREREALEDLRQVGTDIEFEPYIPPPKTPGRK